MRSSIPGWMQWEMIYSKRMRHMGNNNEIQQLKRSLAINERLARSLERKGRRLDAETARIVAARIRKDIADIKTVQELKKAYGK